MVFSIDKSRPLEENKNSIHFSGQAYRVQCQAVVKLLGGSIQLVLLWFHIKFLAFEYMENSILCRIWGIFLSTKRDGGMRNLSQWDWGVSFYWIHPLFALQVYWQWLIAWKAFSLVSHTENQLSTMWRKMFWAITFMWGRTAGFDPEWFWLRDG